MHLFKSCLVAIFILVSLHGISAKPQHSNKDSVVNVAADDTLAACPQNEEIEKIIDDAISLGAPIYNEGLHMACYRIYEWAGYKILYEYGKTCKKVQTIIKTAIDKSHGDYSDDEKAWFMREAFDKVLNVPTQKNDGKEELQLKHG